MRIYKEEGKRIDLENDKIYIYSADDNYIYECNIVSYKHVERPDRLTLITDCESPSYQEINLFQGSEILECSAFTYSNYDDYTPHYDIISNSLIHLYKRFDEDAENIIDNRLEEVSEYERWVREKNTLFTKYYPDLFPEEPKRWKAKEGELYYYIDSSRKNFIVYNNDFCVTSCLDTGSDKDMFRYNIGNYFKIKEDAERIADKLTREFRNIISYNKVI